MPARILSNSNIMLNKILPLTYRLIFPNNNVKIWVRRNITGQVVHL
jgi:hypothetical protein